MTLKNLLIVGIFSALTMSEGKAALYQTLVSQGNQGKIELISWCSRHPHHHKCHHHHHYRPHLWPWYDERYNKRASYCHLHPYREECRRFCNLNPRICYR